MNRASQVVVLALALNSACARPRDDRAEPIDPLLVALRAHEARLRAESPWPVAGLGSDPYVVAAVEPGLYAGILRGDSALVLLDEQLHEIDRAPAGPLADALAIGTDHTVLVGGEANGIVRRFEVLSSQRHAALAEREPIDLTGDGIGGVRALAVHGSGTVYAVDEASDRLVVRFSDGSSRTLEVPRGPFRLAVTERWLVVASLIDHALTAHRLDELGDPTGAPIAIRHDGPFWGLTARERNGVLEIAAGGVEDHALDRSGGSFGYIDSFAFFYEVGPSGAERIHAINVGELGVVTPKALAFTSTGVVVTGYGSDRSVELVAPFDSATPITRVIATPAGVAAMTPASEGGFVCADPLLDAWVKLDVAGDSFDVVTSRSGDDRLRSDRSRLGEALAFTTLMSPWAKAEGPLSRFTCETCHFEGGVDGRTHFTGRGDVHATTKPLRGLFVNEPHFTRALDEDMATMVISEFRVASSNTGHEPIFTLADVEGSPGLPGGVGDVFAGDTSELDGSALGLRESLVEFLRDFGPRENRAVLGRSEMGDLEREGARVFAATCASCHAPRLVADDPRSAVLEGDWEREIFSGDRIVWASKGRELTGIEPYVHREGARPTSLRRVADKRPYFTNGSSRTIEDVLERVWITPDGFLHARDDEMRAGRALSDEERRSLAAFVKLL